MRHRPSPSELFAWTLLGATVGVLAGLTFREYFGPITAGRPRRALARPVPPPNAAAAARAAREAFEADPALRELGLTAIAARPGVVEIHGWVPSRALRSRAGRAAGAIAGIESLVNCLLVHGEDDSAEPPPAVADLPA